MLARQIIPGATYLVTRRCTQRHYFLVPSKRTNQVFHYCLAYAARQTGVLIHAVIVMSNHYHLIVTDPLGVLPVFVEWLNKLVARCLNWCLGRWENFWASEQASYVRLLDHEAMIDKTVYTLCNPVAAALVKSGKDWPGLRFGRPGAYPVHRPDFFFRTESGMPDSVVLELSPLPIEGMSRREAQVQIDEAVAAREAAERKRIRAEGGSFLGAGAVMRQDPFGSPTKREPRRELSPRVASRNKWLRIETLARCADFLREYSDALASWCAEKRDVVFPFGTFLMRHRHQVRCAEA